jgi:putative GTP pyrophosphokinase
LITYDSVQRDEKQQIRIVPEEMICEIQIRTKLQDAWGDITHEFHYKAKN